MRRKRYQPKHIFHVRLPAIFHGSFHTKSIYHGKRAALYRRFSYWRFCSVFYFIGRAFNPADGLPSRLRVLFRCDFNLSRPLSRCCHLRNQSSEDCHRQQVSLDCYRGAWRYLIPHNNDILRKMIGSKKIVLINNCLNKNYS